VRGDLNGDVGLGAMAAGFALCTKTIKDVWPSLSKGVAWPFLRFVRQADKTMNGGNEFARAHWLHQHLVLVRSVCRQLQNVSAQNRGPRP
jgi:hypothetical protein